MRKSTYKHERRRVEGGIEYGYSYPKYLKEEYESDYQYKYTPVEFNNVIKKEIEETRLTKDEIDINYKFFFGKYKGKRIVDVDDYRYLNYVANVFRKKNPRLVGHVLYKIENGDRV